MFPDPSHFLSILRDRPADASVWLELSEAHRLRHETQQCNAAARRAVAIEPYNLAALHQLGWSLLDLGEVYEGLACAQRAAALAPNDPRIRWLRGFALLQLGDYRRGWEDYEARWQIESLKLSRPPFTEPQWHGEDLAGKAIYLYPEQGLGDSLQFVRYVPLVRQRGPKNILLAAPPELETLLARSLPGVHLVRNGQAIPKLDFHCPLMSLPRAFATTLETIPANVPYLQADPEKPASWRRRLAEHPGIKVGLAWAGAPTNPANHVRSLHLANLLPLADVPGVRFVSLQKGPPAAQVAQTPALQILDWTDELREFSDTAALACALDLVLTVCTTISHLAGGLGLPTWTMLAFAADHRWLLDRADSPWYPTMRLFRQPEFGDWDGVVESMKTELVLWRDKIGHGR